MESCSKSVPCGKNSAGECDRQRYSPLVIGLVNSSKEKAIVVEFVDIESCLGWLAKFPPDAKVSDVIELFEECYAE